VPSDNEPLTQILQELKRVSGDLSVVQQDVNAIRNGEYDKPGGADFGMRGQMPASQVGADQGLGVRSREWEAGNGRPLLPQLSPRRHYDGGGSVRVASVVQPAALGRWRVDRRALAHSLATWP
jgi:hypothetical protein